MRDFVYGLVILILIGLLIWQNFQKEYIYRETTKIDTILVRDTIQILAPAKVVYKTKYKIDTLTKIIVEETDSSAYTACLDTTIGKTNLGVCFTYPEKYFSIQANFVPDTIMKTIIVEKPFLRYERKEMKWWEDALKIGAGVVLGYALGKIK